MLSLFPNLFDWSWYVPFIFRIFLGYYFFNLGLHTLKKSDSVAWKLLGGISSLMGVLFVLGVFAQLIGLISGFLSLFLATSQKEHPRLKLESSVFYVLLSLVAFSLLFLGAGPHAIDLPL